MLQRTLFTAATIALSISAASARADTFATVTPVDDGVNMTLSGLTLSAAAPVVFDFQTTALSAFGDLPATLSLSATETGAVAFGPLALGTFDGSFALTYTGSTQTAGGHTVHPGDSLLSGTFLGSVFTGYGTSASVVDSVLGGGLVSYTDNSFLIFDPLADQSITLELTSLSPPSQVVGGELTDFTATSSGLFAADNVTETPGSGGGVPEPATWAMMLLGFVGAGGAVRARRRRCAGQAADSRHRLAIAAVGLGLGVSALAASGASASTFATYRPVGVAKNLTLSGLSLSAAAPTIFTYKTAGLSTLGNLTATLTLSAVETGAVAFGPLALGTFDGSFLLTYTGSTKTAGGFTVHPGDDLLSGTFLGSVFTGYGTSASIVDSVLGGGLVSYTDNSFLTFDPTGDQSISLGLTSLSPPVQVVGGELTDFTAVSSGQFAAAGVTPHSVLHFALAGPAAVPEPATWALMIGGFGLAGAALRRRRAMAA